MSIRTLSLLAAVLALAVAGCTDSEENASTNLRKGDEFFKKGEYDIAEYYYDRIPDDSPLKQTVTRRKEDIVKFRENPALDTNVKRKVKGVFVKNHTFAITSLGVMPVHRFTIVNNTDKTLQFCEMEFVYFDAGGKEVERLNYVANTLVPKDEEKVFDKINPGVVRGKFVRSTATIVKPVFY